MTETSALQRRTSPLRRRGRRYTWAHAVLCFSACNVYTPDLLEKADAVTLGGAAGPTSGMGADPAFRSSTLPSAEHALSALDPTLLLAKPQLAQPQALHGYLDGALPCPRSAGPFGADAGARPGDAAVVDGGSGLDGSSGLDGGSGAFAQDGWVHQNDLHTSGLGCLDAHDAVFENETPLGSDTQP